MALRALTDHPGEAVEVLISRPDAKKLFGLESNSLRDQQIPGLTLTESDDQTLAYLTRKIPTRRLLMTCEIPLSNLGRLLADQRGRVAGIYLSLQTPAAGNSATGRLIALPTIAIRRLPEVPR